MTLAQQELDDLGDFSDPPESERRCRRAIEQAVDPIKADEIRTQLVRALALQNRYSEGHSLLDSVRSPHLVVRTRVALERGRLHKLSGRPDEAYPLFADALELAKQTGSIFLYVDVLHMLALVDGSNAEEWTRQGFVALKDVDDPRTRRWLFALHRNLGAARYDAGDVVGALEEYEAASDAAERYGTPRQRQLIAAAIADLRAAAERP